MELQLIRNATLRLNYGGHRILIDPFFAPKHSRDAFVGVSRNPTADLPLSQEAIMADIELVIISHLHSDHFDPVAQEELPKDWKLICQPGDEATIADMGFTDVMPLSDSITWNGIKISHTDGEHGSGIWKERMGSVMGFVLQAPSEPVVYWAGDTILVDSVKQAIDRYQPDIIVTHSSGAAFEENSPIVMDAEQTIQVCKSVLETKVIAVHMDSLDHATISREDLRTAADEANVSLTQLLIPKDGEILSFS